MFSRYNFADATDIALISNARDGRQYTPDLWKLEQRDWGLLFLPGELMARHPMRSMISSFLLPGVNYAAFTQDQGWSLWKVKADNDGQPMGQDQYTVPIVNHFRSVLSGRIKGELVGIRTYMFIDLDKYYQNGYEFRRIRTNVVVPYRKKILSRIGEMVSDEFTQVIRCWMYVGIPSVWDERFDAGRQFSLVKHYEQKSVQDRWNAGRYFYYSLGEYEQQGNKR